MRLEQLKVTRMFGVPGNYTAPLLNTILEDEKSPIKLTTMSNELVSGYAADGYTRILGRDGVGVVHVTYGVGAMVLLNAVAGSFVENVPVVVINGAPTNKEFIINKNVGLIYQHIDRNNMSNFEVFRNYTVSAQRISNALEAPLKIDSALTAALSYRKPVYLEVFEDVWRKEI
jgi:indolepyruvate decarboxylase